MKMNVTYLYYLYFHTYNGSQSLCAYLVQAAVGFLPNINALLTISGRNILSLLMSLDGCLAVRCVYVTVSDQYPKLSSSLP